MISSKKIIRYMEAAHLSSLQLVRELNKLMGIEQHGVVLACEAEVLDVMRNGTGRYEELERFLKYIFGETKKKPAPFTFTKDQMDLFDELEEKK